MNFNRKLQMFVAGCMMSASLLQNSVGMKEDVSPIKANYLSKLKTMDRGCLGSVVQFTIPMLDCFQDKTNPIVRDFLRKYSGDFDKVHIMDMGTILGDCCENAAQIQRYIDLSKDPKTLMGEFRRVVSNFPFSFLSFGNMKPSIVFWENQWPQLIFLENCAIVLLKAVNLRNKEKKLLLFCLR